MYTSKLKLSDPLESVAVHENCPAALQVTVKVANPKASVGPGLGEVTLQSEGTVKVATSDTAAFVTVTVIG